MTEVGFYHLTRTGVAEALPRLLDRTLKSGQRAVVACPNAEALTELDAALWAAPLWLPHGAAADGDADLQPVWLALDDHPANGARYLFAVGGAPCPNLASFERAFDLFDGRDEAQTAAARARWTAAADHARTYWKQTETGWAKS